VQIKFDDDTRLPLDALPTPDYQLVVHSLNTSIVDFSPASLTAVALSSARGDLLRLELFGGSAACSSSSQSTIYGGAGGAGGNKPPRPLAVGYATVDISIEDEPTQNDATHIGYTNLGGGDRRGTSDWGGVGEVGGGGGGGGGGKNGKGRNKGKGSGGLSLE